MFAKIARTGALALGTGVLAGGVALGAAATAEAAAPAPAVQKAACGGPYKVGDKAVWYNCAGHSVEICVRQYFPYSNYRVMVPARGEHANSWRWTITMSTDLSKC
ncbi:hypothetical protein ACFVH6_12495 [Spirillospora sp. NPDC127200]